MKRSIFSGNNLGQGSRGEWPLVTARPSPLFPSRGQREAPGGRGSESARSRADRDWEGKLALHGSFHSHLTWPGAWQSSLPSFRLLQMERTNRKRKHYLGRYWRAPCLEMFVDWFIHSSFRKYYVFTAHLAQGQSWRYRDKWFTVVSKQLPSKGRRRSCIGPSVLKFWLHLYWVSLLIADLLPWSFLMNWEHQCLLIVRWWKWIYNLHNQEDWIK